MNNPNLLNVVALVLFACALLSGAALLFGILGATSLIPAVFLGAAMVAALLNIIAQSDAVR